MVEFISYACFEVHIEQSLERMDRAWSAIHENKAVFLELNIREHFNIPKFHSLIHYISSICTHETLDGYNTKSPEHLHINFAKVPFRAGNKWDYTAQMATWMSRHEAVWHYDSFLNWAKGNGIIERAGGGDNDNEAEANRNQHKEDDVEVTGCHGYKVAKRPGYGNVTVDALENDFHATDFLWYLKDFLLAHSLPIPQSHDVPFGIFKCLTVQLPQIPQVSKLTTDMIWTIVPNPPNGRKIAVSSQFDTVLTFKKAGSTAFSDPLNPLKGAHFVLFLVTLLIDAFIKTYQLLKFVLSSGYHQNTVASTSHWLMLSGIHHCNYITPRSECIKSLAHFEINIDMRPSYL